MANERVNGHVEEIQNRKEDKQFTGVVGLFKLPAGAEKTTYFI